MTPTVDELREVGLRHVWKKHTYRVLWRRNAYTYTFRVPHIGKRTLGEYWRRRRMVEREVNEYYLDLRGWDSEPVCSASEARQHALFDCRARRWKAWPKPGWRR